MQPWLMWGSTQNPVFIPTGAPGVATPQGVQLARVDYGRPESWTFLLAAQVKQFTRDFGVVTADVLVDFDLTIGLGRSAYTLESFAQFAWTGILPNTGTALIWTTEARSPGFNSADVLEHIVKEFPAQSINVGVRVTATTSGAAVNPKINMEISAAFSPRTHVRPEWFKEGTFKGGEQNGT